MRKPTFASFFSGCGGLDLGFIWAGWEAVFAVDRDAYSCLTYLHNIGPIWRADVERLNRSLVPDADAWIGGPPCQSWSKAGNGAGSDDPRGRLFPWFAEAVAERRPPLFVIENVRHILTFPDFYAVVRRLCRAGYLVLWEVVNSRDFRVPQDRKRVFLVGFQRRAAFGFPGGEPGASRSVRDILVLSRIFLPASSQLTFPVANAG